MTQPLTPEVPVANPQPLPPEGSAPSPFTAEQDARVPEIALAEIAAIRRARG